MPLEIKELHIKATIGDESQESGSGTDSSTSGMDPNLIQSIVEQVLEALEKKGER